MKTFTILTKEELKTLYANFPTVIGEETRKAANMPSITTIEALTMEQLLKVTDHLLDIDNRDILFAKFESLLKAEINNVEDENLNLQKRIETNKKNIEAKKKLLNKIKYSGTIGELISNLYLNN